MQLLWIPLPGMRLVLAAAMALALLAPLGLASTARAADTDSAPCQVSVEPATVEVGEKFVVSGNFGGAEIHFVKGKDAVVTVDEPVATVPYSQTSWSLTFTAEADDVGTWTIWGFIDGSGCGDSALLTIEEATVPDTAAGPSITDVLVNVGITGLLLAVVLVPALRLRRLRNGR